MTQRKGSNTPGDTSVAAMTASPFVSLQHKPVSTPSAGEYLLSPKWSIDLKAQKIIRNFSNQCETMRQTLGISKKHQRTESRRTPTARADIGVERMFYGDEAMSYRMIGYLRRPHKELVTQKADDGTLQGDRPLRPDPLRAVG
jgi:hypothetical protein